MPDRLSSLDVSFLYLEQRATPMHTGSVMVFSSPEGGFDYERLLRHVGARVAFVPRYRQRVKQVPGHLANPVWVDDEGFDLSYHVRRSALPRPGTEEQLRELVARVEARPLDRDRPLWEVYLVEGLHGPRGEDRFAIITKAHQALVDGVSAVDIGQVVLDDAPDAADPPPDTWRPSPEPTAVELVTAAVVEAVTRPTQVLETARTAAEDLRSAAATALGAVGSVLAVARTAARTAPVSPLNVDIGEHRRFGMVATDLADHRRVRAAHSGRKASPSQRLDVNDVVLAVLSGALRSWLLTRGESVGPTGVVRALLPVSVTEDAEQDGERSGDQDRVDGAGGVLGSRVTTYLVDLPVGEPNPVMRLHQVAYQMKSHHDTGRAVSARRLAGIAGFAPPTLHSLGARVASGLSRRLFNVVVTNVPGPQHPLYVAGSRMLATYPVVPLAQRQALAVGLTSYDGGVYYGLNADRTAMPDVDVLGMCVEEALAELVETARAVPATARRAAR